MVQYSRKSNSEMMAAYRNMDVYGEGNTQAKKNKAEEFLYKKEHVQKPIKYAGLNYAEKAVQQQQDAAKRREKVIEKWVTKITRVSERGGKVVAPNKPAKSLEELYLDGEVMHLGDAMGTVCDGTYVTVDFKDLPTAWQDEGRSR